MTITIKRRFEDASATLVKKIAPSDADVMELLKATEELLSFVTKSEIQLTATIKELPRGEGAI